MKILFAFISALLFAACASNSATTETRWSVSAGSGGGFTGMTTGFTLYGNGDVFKWSGMNGNRDNAKRIGAITVDEAKMWVDSLEKIGFYSSSLNAPGNITSFIETDKNGARHIVQWSNDQTAQALAEWSAGFATTCTKLQK